nr:hypothetical protein [Tanacetum cinerariifolium]
MSSPNHPTSDIEDAFSLNFHDYFPATSGNNSLNFSDDFTKYLLATLVFSPLLSPMFDSRDFFPLKEISLKDTKTFESPTLVSSSSSIGSSSPVKSTTPPPDYPFDESIFAELDNSLWIISRPLRGEPNPEEPNEMPPKRTSISEAPAMTQAAIKKLVADSVSAALEAQATHMENTDNTTEPRETLVARNCTYKEFMSCQHFYFNGTEGAVGLIYWFERTKSVFSRSNCTEDCKVKFATCTLTEDALSYAKPIRIEQANNIAWTKLKRLLTNKFQELETLCPAMVPNSKKLIKVFIEGLPRSIEGNVTASKPQTLEGAINITQRLMDHVTNHNSMQETNDHKRKFDDSGNNNNNYPNNHGHNNYSNDHNNNNHSNNRNNNKYQDNRNNNNCNNDHHHQHNRKQETFRTYAATNGCPLCERCTMHHIGPCTVKFWTCNKVVSPMLDSRDFLPPKKISPKDTETFESPTSLSPISSVGSSLPVRMPPKKTSTSAAPAMTQAVIRQLIADRITAALEAQAATMANTNNTNRNTRSRKTLVARKCTYKEFMSCQPFHFNVNKMEDEFYNDLKTYIRRFQDLALLYPNMVPNSEKLMEVFIGGLPRSIEGNFIASKHQTLEEAKTITQRLMEQIEDDDDIEEMDIKWNLALLSMRADRFWKKTGKKITIQEFDVAGFDKSKVECFNCHKMGHFARECRSPKSQDRGKRVRERERERERATRRILRLLESQKLDKDKKGVGFNEYCVIPPPLAQVYLPPKKDLSWMGLLEFVDDTVTDYTRPTPSIDVSKSVSKEQEERWKSNNPSFFEQGGSSGNVFSKPMIKFVKESGCPNATKVNNTENARKPTRKYAEMYRNTSQSPRVRGNQRNWNNRKSQQLGKDYMMQNKVCYNCGSFDHLEFNCKHNIWVDKGKTRTKVNHAQDNMKYTSTHKSSNFNGVSVTFKKYQYIDTQGRLKHMTGNISYLSEYEPFNGGYVSFGHERGKITSKGSIKTGIRKWMNSVLGKVLRESLVTQEPLSRMVLLKEETRLSLKQQGPCTKEDVHQAVKEKESPLRFIALPNLFHEAQMATSNEAAKKDDAIPDNNALQKEQEEVNGDKEVPESSGNSNPTASTKVSTNDSFKLATSLTVETKVPTISTHVPTDSLSVPPVTSGRPMGIEYGVSWVWEQFHMGCWGECFGTVLMDAGAL